MQNPTASSGGDPTWFIHDRFGLFIHWGNLQRRARHEWCQNLEKIPRRRLPGVTSTTSIPTCMTRPSGLGKPERRE